MRHCVYSKVRALVGPCGISLGCQGTSRGEGGLGLSWRPGMKVPGSHSQHLWYELRQTAHNS